MIKKNDVAELEITGMTHDGSGVGRIDGMAIFVPNTAIGDIAKVHILKVKKNYAYGKLISLITPSPDRITPDCPVFSKCGGCTYRHISYDAELKIKTQKVIDAFVKNAGITPPIEDIIPSDNTDRYRNKGQYPLSISNDGKIISGFFAPYSHRVIACDDCLLAPLEFSKIIDFITDFIANHNITIYDETKHKGLVRHIYLRSLSSGREIMVCLVVNGDTVPFADELVSGLVNLNSNIKSVIININKADTNVITGEQNIILYGDGYVTDTLCNTKFRISPLSFYQVNSAQTEKLYRKAGEYAALKPDDILLDLYCGVGTIGLTMAKKCKKLYGVEIIPEAIEDAKINALENGITNAEFYAGDAADMATVFKNKGISPNVVILDPPRKGCSQELINTVANDFTPDRIVYVSCDPATLARDCKLFSQLGYNLEKLNPVDMFPRTSHVETVALLSRQKVDEHIYFDVNVQDLPKTARTTATYPEIKAYVKNKYGLNVTSLNIAQVKEKHGFEKRQNYNKGKDGHRVPNCPPEKEKAIEDAFKHFGML